MTERVLESFQVVNEDRKAIYHFGIPRVVLMENAGRNVAEFIISRTRERDKIAIFSGSGYNGGDSLVSARHLFLNAREVTVYMVGDLSRLKPETVLHLRIVKNLGIKVKIVNGKSSLRKLKNDLRSTKFIVDGLLGTGTKGEVRSPLKDVVEILNSLDIKKIAVDIPSGIDCDSGQPLGTALKADYTITFKALKKGMVSSWGRRFCGEIFLTQIGG